MSVTAGLIMDRSAAFLNDAAKTQFTYAIQIPFLNAAIDELQEGMQLNSVHYVNQMAPIIVVTAGVFTISFVTTPALPANLIAPQGIQERLAGSCTPFTMMTKQEFLIYDQPQQQSLNVWTWQNQVLNFVGALTDREILVDYVATFLPIVTASTDVLTLFNCESFLAFRTAGLQAILVGENKTRADELNQFADMALERFLRINSKGNTAIIMPRKPYVGVFKPKDEN